MYRKIVCCLTGLMLGKAAKAEVYFPQEVIVAVIDTGADVAHPDLRNKLWVNPGETGLDENGRDKSSNGIDDDGNGFVDDVNGWNFAGRNNDLFDRHGHGTHIAGIIATAASTPGVKIMVLKFYDPMVLVAPIDNATRAIQYATKMGAKIINFSAGGKDPNPKERAAISEAGRQGVLFVAAAGNEHNNSDVRPYFPADYDLPNILSVTAVDRGERLMSFSNYGTKSVDIAALGGPVLSAAPGGAYDVMSGTSQATASVSGAAALLAAAYGPQIEPREMIQTLIASGKTNGHLAGKIRYEVQLDSARALVMKDSRVSATGVRASNFSEFEGITFGTR